MINKRANQTSNISKVTSSSSDDQLTFIKKIFARGEIMQKEITWDSMITYQAESIRSANMVIAA
jgi:hypothetical protein